ncbi:hypothetical protein G7072_19030 [Nocardioides sp. HDW12B]|uniref:hypothetical protein n=1 Tax=Nocardioides sp. HDW12B TaxID=2714939 RepID=UPI001407B79F|nr:hypothetical protein [Nocardioides sp. HDW12B]QIK68151.1 hypothetical protein G7072_19030 [Nocardioides sp. HDW12B]
MSASVAPGPPRRQRPRPPGRLVRPRLLLALLLVVTLVALTAGLALALRIRSEVLAVRTVATGSSADPGAATRLGEDPAEAVSFPTGRGELPALLVEGRSRTWAVLVHDAGWGPEQTAGLAAATVAVGLPTLAITYRNDAGVAPDPSGRYGWGRTEWRDLEAAVAYAQEEGAEGVVLGGLGMGGAVVAAYLELAEREDGLVRGLLLDAPALDLAAVVDADLASLDLPLGLRVPRVAAAAAREVSSRLDGVDWDAVDYLDDTSWLEVPALVRHSADDPTVPLEVSRRLVAAEPDLARLVALPPVETARSERRVERFVRAVR